MNDLQSLRHTVWECKYHVVLGSEVSEKVCMRSFAGIWEKLSAILPRQRESRVEEGHLRPDHVHMLISIPAEALSSSDGRVHQRKECDPHCSELPGT